MAFKNTDKVGVIPKPQVLGSPLDPAAEDIVCQRESRIAAKQAAQVMFAHEQPSRDIIWAERLGEVCLNKSQYRSDLALRHS